MSTYYTFTSTFVANRDITEEQIRHAVRNNSYCVVSEDHGISFRESDNRLHIDMTFSDSLGDPNDLDEEWINLAKEFADFEFGPYSCTSGGDYYEDNGPFEWFIGTKKSILLKEIDKVNSQIQDLLQRQANLRKQSEIADDKEIIDNHDDDILTVE